jgi:hypothetical protein
MFCVDLPSETCSPDSTKGCTGLCAGRRHAIPCAGSGQSTACPDGFACVPDTQSYRGTDPYSICVGPETKGCTTASDCPSGFLCVESADGGRCSPDLVACDWAVTCRVAPPEPCPGGYAQSTADGCFGPCVPVEYCACSSDWVCAMASASCDRKAGRCYAPQSPEPRCLLPFDAGPCDSVVAVFAFLDGECRAATYGGCGGNDNRFSRLEECLSRCQGMPGERPCPQGRAERVVCLACGAGGGCIQYAGVCAKECATQVDCQNTSFSCANGYCEAVFCV